MITAAMQGLAQWANALTLAHLPDLESSDSTKLYIISVSFTFFCALYIIEILFQPKLTTRVTRHHWCVRIPSQYHAVMVTVIGWLCFFDTALWSDPINSSSPVAVLGACIISGYMSADFISVIVNFEDEGFTFLFHAIFTLAPYAASLYTGKFYAISCTCLIAETSTVPLNLRYLCILSKRAGNAVFEAIQLGFFLVFIVVRIFVANLCISPIWFNMFGAIYVTGDKNGAFKWSEVLAGSGSFSNMSNYDAPVWFWIFMSSALLVMTGLNGMWAVGMIKIALGLGGGDKKKDKKEKKKEKKWERMNVTVVNWPLYLPVLLLPVDKEKGKKE